MILTVYLVDYFNNDKRRILYRLLTVSVPESSDPHDSDCFVCVLVGRQETSLTDTFFRQELSLKEESEQLAGKPTRDFRNDFHVSCTNFALVMDGKELMVVKDE